MPRMNAEGGYEGGNVGMVDKGEGSVQGIDLKIDPNSIPELKDYQPGDTIDLTLKCKLSDQGDESGMVQADVLSVSAEPMSAGMKSMRMANRPPDMSGTNIKMGQDEQ